MLRVVIERGQGGADPHLGHAVGGERLQRVHDPLAPPGHRRRAVHARREDPCTQAAQVPGIGLLGVAQHLHVGLESVRDGRAFALDEVERLVGIEGFGKHLPGACRHRHHSGFRVAEGVEQRQIAHDGVVLGDRHAERTLLDVADEPVVVQHALRESGGTGGVHHEHGIVGIHGVGARREFRIGYRRLGKRRRPGRRAVVVALADNDDPGEFGKRRVRDGVALGRKVDHLTHHVEVVDGTGGVVGDQHGAVGLAQHVLEVVGAEARVDRDLHRADLGERVHEEHPLRTVVEPQRDVVAALDA